MSNGDQTITGAGNWDGALAALDADGAPLWLRGAGGPGVDNVRGTAVGPDGSVYASGQCTGDVPVLGTNLRDEGTGDDFLMRLSAGGSPLWTVTTGGPGPGVGGEIRSWDNGVAVSSLLSGDQTIHGPGETLPLDLIGNQTGYLAAFGASGKARFAYLPEPIGPLSGTAPGGALAVSPDGLDLALSLRVRGQISLDGQTTLNSPTGDSAVIRLTLPPAPRPARVRIVKASPRRFTLGPRTRLRKVRVRVKNQGDIAARKVRVCFRGSCRKGGSLGPGKARTLTLRIRARMFRGKGIRRPRIRLRSGNAGRDSIRLRVRLN